MQGCKVLWVPGCDHAGIATQVVYLSSLFFMTFEKCREQTLLMRTCHKVDEYSQLMFFFFF